MKEVRYNKEIVATVVALCMSMMPLPVHAAIQVDKEALYIDVDYSAFTSKNQATMSVSTFTLTNTGEKDETVSITIETLPSGYSADHEEVIVESNTTSSSMTLTAHVPHSKRPYTVKMIFFLEELVSLSS
jgi:hypothetical protein